MRFWLATRVILPLDCHCRRYPSMSWIEWDLLDGGVSWKDSQIARIYHSIPLATRSLGDAFGDVARASGLGFVDGTRNDLPMDEDGRLAYPVSWAACVVLMERRDTSSVRMLPSCCPEGVIKRHLQNWKLYSVFLNTFMGMCCGTCSIMLLSSLRDRSLA